MEEYRPIPGYEGLYWASDVGRIKSRKRILRPATGRYLTVGLWRDGVQKTERVHQLVLRAFRGPRPDGMVVRHLDGDPHNNRLSNLVYGTQSENIHDALAHGTWAPALKTHCPQGHPYDEANTLLVKPSVDSKPIRRCRECVRIRNRAAYRRNAESRKAYARERYRANRGT